MLFLEAPSLCQADHLTPPPVQIMEEVVVEVPYSFTVGPCQHPIVYMWKLEPSDEDCVAKSPGLRQLRAE